MASDRPDGDRHLDVREIDGEPFGEIMAALDALDDEETLVLTAGFEPVPLYGVLEERGFQYEPTNPEPDRWHVEITPR